MHKENLNIYLDNAATTKPDSEVVALSLKINENSFANPASTHHLGLNANTLLNKYRESILKSLNLRDYRVIFTSSATEGLNLAIKGYALKYQNRGKHIITTNIEHPAVLESFSQLKELFGFKVTFLEVNSEGQINLDELKTALTKETTLVSVMAVNNETGTISNLKEIKEVLKDYPKCAFLSDTTQAISKAKIDYSLLDMFVISSHKIHGLKNSGVLIAKKNISFIPLTSGGGQEEGLRSGTVSLENAATLALALHKEMTNFDKNFNYVKELNLYLRNKLKDIDGVTLNSPETATPYILSMSLNKKSAVIVEYLSEHGIYVSSVSACHSKREASSYVVFAMFRDEDRAKNTLRVSFSHDNTKEEIEYFVDTLKEGLRGIR